MSATDEEQNSNFDELCTNSYSNGQNNALTYYTTTDPNFTQSTQYFNSAGQVISDATYLVMEQSENSLTENKQSNEIPTVHLEDEYKHLFLQQQRSISVQPQTVKWLLEVLIKILNIFKKMLILIFFFFCKKRALNRLKAFHCLGLHYTNIIMNIVYKIILNQ